MDLPVYGRSLCLAEAEMVVEADAPLDEEKGQENEPEDLVAGLDVFGLEDISPGRTAEVGELTWLYHVLRYRPSATPITAVTTPTPWTMPWILIFSRKRSRMAPSGNMMAKVASMMAACAGPTLSPSLLASPSASACAVVVRAAPLGTAASFDVA
jgi:hypothetical protein